MNTSTFEERAQILLNYGITLYPLHVTEVVNTRPFNRYRNRNRNDRQKTRKVIDLRGSEKSDIKQIRGILNKITDSNFKTMVSKILELQYNDSTVIEIIYEKAMLEPVYCKLYAELCLGLPDIHDFLEDKCIEQFRIKKRNGIGHLIKHLYFYGLINNVEMFIDELNNDTTIDSIKLLNEIISDTQTMSKFISLIDILKLETYIKEFIDNNDDKEILRDSMILVYELYQSEIIQNIQYYIIMLLSKKLQMSLEIIHDIKKLELKKLEKNERIHKIKVFKEDIEKYSPYLGNKLKCEVLIEKILN